MALLSGAVFGSLLRAHRVGHASLRGQPYGVCRLPQALVGSDWRTSLWGGCLMAGLGQRETNATGRRHFRNRKVFAFSAARHAKCWRHYVMDKPFEFGVFSAQGPGQFGNPGQDINCRCALRPVAILIFLFLSAIRNHFRIR